MNAEWNEQKIRSVNQKACSLIKMDLKEKQFYQPPLHFYMAKFPLLFRREAGARLQQSNYFWRTKCEMSHGNSQISLKWKGQNLALKIRRDFTLFFVYISKFAVKKSHREKFHLCYLHFLFWTEIFSDPLLSQSSFGVEFFRRKCIWYFSLKSQIICYFNNENL